MTSSAPQSPIGFWLSRFFFNDTATTEIYTLSLHDALPIPEVFTETQDFSFDTLSRWFREWAFLNKGLKIRLVDQREEARDVTYQYEGGIRDFVEHINEAKDPVHKTIFYLEREEEVG